MSDIRWEPILKGIRLAINNVDFELDMHDVAELAADMEEAFQLACGFEKHKVCAEDLALGDRVFIGPIPLIVTNVLTDLTGKTVIQGINDEPELMVSNDYEFTVWRRIQ